MVTASTVSAEEAAVMAWKAAGHLDEFPRDPEHRWVCRCGWVSTGTERGFIQWDDHVTLIGTSELERRGLLPPGSAAFAAKLLERWFEGTLAQIQVLCAAILGPSRR